MGYDTDKDLRSLFRTFPRRDDGTEITLPRHFPDTIQPVVDLQKASAELNDLVIERDQRVTAFPTQTSGTLVVPANERWLVWRLIGFCSDTTTRIIHLRKEGGGALLAIAPAVSAPVNVPVFARGPFVLNPTDTVDVFSNAVLGAGALSIDAVFTRFALDETLPQVNTIF